MFEFDQKNGIWVVDMGSYSRVDLDYNGDSVRDAVLQVTTLDGGHLTAADFLL